MKKIFGVFAAGVAALALTSCDDETDKGDGNGNVPTYNNDELKGYLENHVTNISYSARYTRTDIESDTVEYEREFEKNGETSRYTSYSSSYDAEITGYHARVYDECSPQFNSYFRWFEIVQTESESYASTTMSTLNSHYYYGDALLKYIYENIDYIEFTVSDNVYSLVEESQTDNVLSWNYNYKDSTISTVSDLSITVENDRVVDYSFIVQSSYSDFIAGTPYKSSQVVRYELSELGLYDFELPQAYIEKWPEYLDQELLTSSC